MIRATQIALVRAEGRTWECVTEVVRTAPVFLNANLTLVRWSRSAPEAGSGYHKCDFVVTFEDGHTYEGRFDLERGEWPNLERHMLRHCEASAGRWRPPHATEAQWAAYLRDVVGAEKSRAYSEFLDAYQIGDEAQ
jgi:hypothetical protein